MPNDVLQSYLVSLGFATDQSSYDQFRRVLADADRLVDSTAFRMVKNFVGVGAGAVSAFAAIGVATAGLLDKVSTADQNFRLFALHMYTSLPVARELKTALNALGQPLENVIFDSELAGRFRQLISDQEGLTAQLGPDFEQNMVRVRDARFQLTRFSVELQYFAANATNALVKAFGGGAEDLITNLRVANLWFTLNIPRWSQLIATNLKPVLLDVANIIGEAWRFTEDLAAAFVHFMGIVSGDKSLANAALSFETFAAAMKHVETGLKDMVLGMLKAGELLTHLLSAAMDANNLQFGAALDELKKAAAMLTPATGAAIGAAAGMVIGGPVGAAIGAGIGDIGGEVTQAAMGRGPSQSDKTRQAIAKVAEVMGVPPGLALAVAEQESGIQQFDKSGQVLRSSAGALGIMQLMPETARRMGVDATNAMSNVIGGVKYLKELLQQSHGDVARALDVYSGGARNYAQQVLARERVIEGGDVHVSVVINAPSGDAKAIAAEVQKVLDQSLQRPPSQGERLQIMRNLNELASGWSYGG